MLAYVIDFFLISNSFILCKTQDFKGFYTIKKFLFGGSRGGRSYFYGIVYTENCKTDNLDSYGLVVLSYKHHREMSMW